jgi:hypothetical protein
MKIPKSIGSPRQAILLVALAVLLVLAVVRWRPGGAPPKPASPSVAVQIRATPVVPGEDAAASRATRGRAREREVRPEEVQVIAEDDFKVRPSREGTDTVRDLFGVPSEPTKKPPPTPFPPPPPPGDARFIGPLPPPPPTPTPRPPDVTFKFVGTFGPKGHPIAVIQEGDKVYNVREGDVLFDKFVLRSVGYESIDVGFVGYPEAKPTRIGITPN